MNWFTRLGWFWRVVVVICGLVAVALVGLGIYRAVFITNVDNYQMAYKFDRLDKSGKIRILKQIMPDGSVNYERGWVAAMPIVVSVNTVDLRPMQVCMNANSRVLNCKLVQFNPDGLELFLSWHGRNDYEGPNSSGTTTTSGTNTGTVFSEILTSYAYDGNEYPFLTIIKELKPEMVNNPVKTSQSVAPKVGGSRNEN